MHLHCRHYVAFRSGISYALQACGRGYAGHAGTARKHSTSDELVRGCQDGGPSSMSGITASITCSEAGKQQGQGMPEAGQVQRMHITSLRKGKGFKVLPSSVNLGSGVYPRAPIMCLPNITCVDSTQLPACHPVV